MVHLLVQQPEDFLLLMEELEGNKIQQMVVLEDLVAVVVQTSKVVAVADIKAGLWFRRICLI